MSLKNLKDYNDILKVLNQKILNQTILNDILKKIDDCYNDVCFLIVEDNKLEFKDETLRLGIYIREDGNNIVIVNNIDNYRAEFVFDGDETIIYDFKINDINKDNHYYRFKGNKLKEERELIKAFKGYRYTRYIIKHYNANNVLISDTYTADYKTTTTYSFGSVKQVPIMANFNTIEYDNQLMNTNEASYKNQLELNFKKKNAN